MDRKRLRFGFVPLICVAVILASIGVFSRELMPADAADTAAVMFTVAPGEGFRAVADNLVSAHLIRSALAFEAYALLGGRALAFKPGTYKLDPAMSSGAIVKELAAGGTNEVTVTIPEGSNIYRIDAILSDAAVIKPGTLIALRESGSRDGNPEGRLFPDTYRFYIGSDAASVAAEMENTFNEKVGPLFAAAGISTSTAAGRATEEQTITLASILEKEVPDDSDREIVAGILLKREKADMPLDVDATVCYAKLLGEHGGASSSVGASSSATEPATASCPTLSALDFKIKSPYNTYLYGGFPPGPIGNPGTSSIAAALHPQSSPYWYYLSDPATGKTIFAKTLDEQNANRVKYLERD